MENVSKYTDVIEERMPELLDSWKGMADGAELDYDKVLHTAKIKMSGCSIWAKPQVLIAPHSAMPRGYRMICPS